MNAYAELHLSEITQNKSVREALKYSRGNAPKTKRVDREGPEQKALIDWARVTIIAGYRIGDYLTHVPNEGKRGPKAQNQFKNLGGQAGYPDLILDIPTKKYHGLRIEMKPHRRYKSTVTKEQRKWIERLGKVGYKAAVCYGFEEAKAVIEKYLPMTL